MGPTAGQAKVEDIAAFTGLVSLDASAPRTLRIVGEGISSHELLTLAQEVSGERFRLINGGSIADLNEKIARLKMAASPEDRELYPDWQLMMYMRTMYSGNAEVGALDNQRYPNLHWTTARELLEARFAASSTPRQ